MKKKFTTYINDKFDIAHIDNQYIPINNDILDFEGQKDGNLIVQDDVNF